MNRIWAGLFSAVLALAICLPVHAAEPAAPAAEQAAPEKPVGSDVGMFLKDFSLKGGVDGKTYNVAALSKDGKDSALIFMQTACSLCLAEIREFDKAKDRLEGNLNVYLVSVDIDPGRIKPYVEGNNLDFTVIHDGDAVLLDALKFNSTPCLAVIDKAGKIKIKKAGFDTGEVRAMIKGYSK